MWSWALMWPFASPRPSGSLQASLDPLLSHRKASMYRAACLAALLTLSASALEALDVDGPSIHCDN
eukprot:2485804-Amphidinium_carterae.1